MTRKQKSNYNPELLTDTEIYATIRDLDPDPRSTREQESNWDLEGLTDAESYAAIRYLDPDAGSANLGEVLLRMPRKLDHPALPVICLILVILIILELVWFFR